MTYTPAQIREYLRIAAPTLNKYSRLFKDYLTANPPRRKRKYTQKDLYTLTEICHLARSGVKLADIAQYLEKPSNPEDKTDGESPPKSLDEAFLSLKAQVELLAELIENQSANNKRLLEIDNQRSESARKIVKRFQALEERLLSAIRMHSYYRYDEQIQRLKDRVTDLEIEAKKNPLQKIFG